MISGHCTLAITTSAATEVAVLGDRLSITVPATGAALESLLPCVQQALIEANIALEDIELIAVCTGPGSFTGLRIGVAFAKSLAQARDLPIVGVSAYDVAEYHIEDLPVIAVAKGKSNYYYARVRADAQSAAEFLAGDATAIEGAVKDLQRSTGLRPVVTGSDFTSYAPGERARRVALLGRQAQRAGGATTWRDVTIDYGQRPNAVINWEIRRTHAQEGQSFEPREIRADEGPASPA